MVRSLTSCQHRMMLTNRGRRFAQNGMVCVLMKTCAALPYRVKCQLEETRAHSWPYCSGFTIFPSGAAMGFSVLRYLCHVSVLLHSTEFDEM